jgi:hypothetical protein
MEGCYPNGLDLLGQGWGWMVSYGYLAWLIPSAWRWRWHVPPKHQLTFNRPRGVILQKIELWFIICCCVRNCKHHVPHLPCTADTNATHKGSSLARPFSWSGVRLSPSVLQFHGPVVPSHNDKSVLSTGRIVIGRGKPDPVPLSLAQILHWLPWDWTCNSVVRR